MTLRHAVLGLLTRHSGSGYDLLKEFQTSLANVWPATQSQLYTELGKLADSGLVSVSAEGPRGRKEYAITDTGRAELRHWLAETEPEVIRRSDLLLRVFFLGTLEPDEARAFLTGRADKATERLDQLRALNESVEWDAEDFSVYGRLSLEWGLRFFQMQREWAQWSIEQLDARHR